ncbi:MAG: hypothetical protein JWP92_137 [Caulobacter sp.]|nr:hypothetical protein [Caulobacter sp.]
MTVAPDPAEIVAPTDPALYARRRVIGVGFWIGMIAGVLCMVAALAVANFGPRWFPVRQAEPAAPARLADPAPIAAVSPPAPAPLASAVELGAPSAEVARLDSRLARLESGQARALDAAAAALAAATLAEASQTARPFSAELTSLEQVLPQSADLRALARLAPAGAPTRAGLDAAFEDLAARAATAARDPGGDADLLSRLRHALASIVSIRQVGSTRGTTPDAVLARAQRQLDEGDIEAAVRTLDALPDSAQVVLAKWRAAAERRIEIDRHVAAIRAEALAGLAQVTGAQATRAQAAAVGA